jgi:tetratricopeptide (TPR) repeat protein
MQQGMCDDHHGPFLEDSDLGQLVDLGVGWNDDLEAILRATEEEEDAERAEEDYRCALASEVAFLESAVQSNIDNTAAWRRLAELATKHGDFPSAMRYCVNAVSSNHFDADAWCELAEALMRARQVVRGSVLRLRKDIELTPFVCARAALKRAPHNQRALRILAQAGIQG